MQSSFGVSTVANIQNFGNRIDQIEQIQKSAFQKMKDATHSQSRSLTRLISLASLGLLLSVILPICAITIATQVAAHKSRKDVQMEKYGVVTKGITSPEDSQKPDELEKDAKVRAEAVVAETAMESSPTEDGSPN